MISSLYWSKRSEFLLAYVHVKNYSFFVISWHDKQKAYEINGTPQVLIYIYTHTGTYIHGRMVTKLWTCTYKQQVVSWLLWIVAPYKQWNLWSEIVDFDIIFFGSLVGWCHCFPHHRCARQRVTYGIQIRLFVAKHPHHTLIPKLINLDLVFAIV